MLSLAKRTLLPLGAGMLGAVFLTGVYLGIVSLAESPKVEDLRMGIFKLIVARAGY